MTPAQERWAEAAAVLRLYGDQAGIFVSSRVAALTLEQDQDGVRRWKEIAARLHEMTAARRQ